MTISPNTPVLVGTAQLTNHRIRDLPLTNRDQPVELMAKVLDLAAADCGGDDAGRKLLEQASILCAIQSLAWSYVNPAQLVAKRLAIEPKRLATTTVGGNSPQMVATYAAKAIQAGQMEVALVVGADCVYTRRAARKDPTHPALGWTTQPDDTPPPLMLGTDKEPTTLSEVGVGMDRPARVFPLFENAIRHARGWSIAEHRQNIGKLWSSLSSIAAGNPYAWQHRKYSPEEIYEVGENNRMICFPYTKLLNANMQVDQGAAFIMCSLEAARAAGVPSDRFVFPVAGVDADDHWFVSHRLDLHKSPAIEIAGHRALELASISIDDIEYVDLYSCFPSAVQIAADALGLPVNDPGRPLSVTGGLTFAGGPGNNYVSHSISAMAKILRGKSEALGLVTGLGWYVTKHSIGVWSSDPPAAGFRYDNPQEQVNTLPQRPPAPAEGTTGKSLTLETYTVWHSRDGAPEFGIASYLNGGGRRGWGRIMDADTLSEIENEEGCGRTAELADSGNIVLT
ncbi:MAG: acetyl-CoA acetyltransferase [Actinobacteria bacterium]|nr:acetyl-CoA acetyltransferase [Actinomycetota bacterium]